MSVSLNEVYRMALQLDEKERQQLADYLTNPPSPPTVEQVLEVLSRHREELRAQGVERIGVFGSYARGEADPASDVDILVVLNQTSFTGYMRLKLYLEELLGQPVDLVTADAIRDELRDQILNEVVYAPGI